MDIKYRTGGKKWRMQAKTFLFKLDLLSDIKQMLAVMNKLYFKNQLYIIPLVMGIILQ